MELSPVDPSLRLNGDVGDRPIGEKPGSQCGLGLAERGALINIVAMVG